MRIKARAAGLLVTLLGGAGTAGWGGLPAAAQRPPERTLPITAPLRDPLPASLPEADAAQLRRELDSLAEQLSAPGERAPDAEVFYKAAVWALRYDQQLGAADVALVRKMLARARERLAGYRLSSLPWDAKKGKLVRGYISAVDGSVQPYGLVVPAAYDRRKPMRLDVVLHGSTRPVGLSEARFMARFDEGDDGGVAPDQPYFELHPLGRVENCYRWAGETDVFEAIEDVCRKYLIDRDRIVLRGMSMGASGTWHLGLKHPDRFVALGPYCGYVDTHRFSETPLPNFVRVGPLPSVQETLLHMLDSVDYAANAGVVPTIAAMGEKDVFFQAHVIMGEAMRREGLELVNLISPGTGHVQDPKTHAEQMRRIGEYASKGRDRLPRKLRFVTWTLKYSRCHWLQLLELDRHYERAEIQARIDSDGLVAVDAPKNIVRFAVLPEALQSPDARLLVAGEPIPLPAGPHREPVVVERHRGSWRLAGKQGEPEAMRKRPGLQGPIDDAFTAPFLCVRGTGKPWNSTVQAWSDATLRRFSYEWNRYMRGDLPVKNDDEVTPEDLRTRHLILFGDPGSNRWIARALPKLPLRWTPTELHLDGGRFSASEHAPALIYPNPLPGAKDRYLVLNSGHTFHEPEFSTLNYLLFPRLGDFAIFKLGRSIPAEPDKPLAEEVVRTGLFNERWKVSE
jgi:poly(3-hydroxybutyrate) depolymerase